MNSTVHLIITTQRPGFHAYPNAPANVAFLRHAHRHLFKFIIYFTVTGLDREREFFTLQGEVHRWLNGYPTMGNKDTEIDFQSLSCEHIAEHGLRFLASWGCHAVEVWEDGENGARVQMTES